MTTVCEKFLAVLRAAVRGEKADAMIALSLSEINEIFALSHAQGIFPLIFDALCRHESVSGLETAYLASLKHRAMMQATSQTVAEAEFLRLFAYLTANGVSPVVMKGIVCRGLYPKGELRRSCDEDILVPEGEFSRAAELIESFGLTFSGADRASRELAFASRTSPLRIELQSTPFSESSSAYGDFNRFFGGVFADSCTDSTSGVRTMCPTDHFTYLVLHAAQHFLHSGFGIRQICDICLFAEHHSGEIDLCRALSACRDSRTEHFAAAVLRIGEDKLGIEASLTKEWRELIAADDGSAILEDVFAAGVYGSADETRLHSSNITLNAASSAKSGKKRRNGIASSLFPSAKALEGRYRYLKKAPFLLPIAWVSRAVTFAARPGFAKGGADALKLGEKRVELLRKYKMI